MQCCAKGALVLWLRSALQDLCKGAMWRFSSSVTTKADWAGGTFAAAAEV